MATDPNNVFPHDNLADGLGDFSSNLTTANDGFRDFLGQLGNLSGSIKNLDKSILTNSNALGTGMSELANMSRYSSGMAGKQQGPRVQPNFTPSQPYMPDMGSMFGAQFQHPAMSRMMEKTASAVASERPSLGKQVLSSYGADANKNLLQAGHSLNPLSFLQYSMMFGASFPVQMKMAEVMTKPVTDTGQTFDKLKSFSSGFTGIGDAIQGFSNQLTRSPLQSYEGIYQSKIMLSSALGGEKQSNAAVNNAMKMAREYPVKTEQVLSSLSRLAVYPEVKPHLQNEDFQKKLMETVSGLSLIVPEQGLEGAMFSIVEAMSGSWRSMQMRFNVSPEIIQSMSGMTKSEMSSDPTKLISGLHTFVGKAVGLDVLEKQKNTFSKQVDNFGDSLQILTKEVFERTDLYKSVTGGAALFQTGFSSLAGNQNFVNYIGGVFQPFQNRLDSAFANFAGVGVGAYKSMPMTQIMAAMTKNFEGMSMDEIGMKFETLIDDLGGIWKDTNNKLSDIMNSKFGDVLGKIGGDIASVAGNAFSGMTSAVLKGIGNSFMENPMNIIGPAASMALPLGAVLGGIQLIPTTIQKLFEGGFIRRGAGKLGNALWGQSNTQAGEILIQQSQNNIKRMISSGGKISDVQIGNLNQTDRLAKEEFTRVSPKNFNRLLNSHVDELGKSSQAIREATMREVNKSLIGELDTRRDTKFGSPKDGRTPQSKIDEIFKGLQDETKMSDAQKASTKAYYNKLKDAGFSDGDIAKIQRTQTNAAVRQLEDDNYRDYGSRQLRAGDEKKLRREILSPKYNYEQLSDEAIETIQSGQKRGKLTPGELPFKQGDEVTQTYVDRAKGRANTFGKITEDLELDDFNKKLADGAFSNKELSAFAKSLDVNVSELKPTTTTTTNLLGQRTTQITPPKVSDDMLATLKESAKTHRGVYDEIKGLHEGFQSGKYTNPDTYTHPAQQYVENRFAGIGQAASIESAKKQLATISGYDANELLSSKTANRMTRLLNLNEESLKGFEVPIADQKTRTALGLKEGQQLNVLEAINTPEFQRFQRGGLGELTKMSAPEAQQAMRGNAVLREIVDNSSVREAITSNMDTGAKRLSGLSSLTRFSELLDKSPMLKGIGRVASVGLAAVDPAVLGLQATDIASNLGATKQQSFAVGAGTAVTTGGAMAGLQANAARTAWKEMPVPRGLATVEQVAAARTATAANFAKSMTNVAGAGGALALVTALFEVASQKTGADKKVRDDQKAYKDELDKESGLTTEQRKNLEIMSTSAVTADRATGGKEGLMQNGWLKAALIAGGLGTAILSGGTLLPMLGLAAASMGTTWATGDYFEGSAKESEQTKNFKGNARSLYKGVAFYDDRIKQYDQDINDLQFSKSLTGGELSREENAKLVTTKKLREDAVQAKANQLGAVNTVTKIGTIADEFDVDEITGEVNIRKKSTSEKLNEYLKTNKPAEGKDAISEYLGAATVDVTGKKEATAKMQKAIESGDRIKIAELISTDADSNNLMTERFNNATAKLDYKDSNQVETIRQAEVARLNEMVVPMGGTKEDMQKFKSANQGNLMNTFLKSNLLSSFATDPNQKNLYSSIETAVSGKMTAAQIGSPYDLLKNQRDGKKFTAEDYAIENVPLSNEKFANLDNRLRERLAARGIKNAEDLYNTDLATLPTTGPDKFGKLSMNALQAVNDDNRSRRDAKAQEYKDVQFGAFKTVTQTLFGKEGQEALTKIDKEQQIYKNIDLGGFSKPEQANIQRTLTRREGAVNELRGNSQFQQLVNRMFGSEGNQFVDVATLTDKQLKEVQDSKEFQGSGFDATRNAMATLGKTTTTLNGTFATTKDQVEKKFGNALEKAGEAATNFAYGVIKGDKFEQSGGIGQIDDMKNAVNSLKESGKKQEATAGRDFTDLVKSDASLQNLTSSLGIKSVADLSKKDESGITGMDKLYKSGYSNETNLIKLAEASGMYQAGQKQVIEAGALGIEGAKKSAEMAFKTSASGSEEMDMANQMSTFDWKNKKRLKQASVEEVQYALQSYKDAKTPEEKAAALGNLKSQTQAASRFMNVPELANKVGLGLWKEVTNILTDEATAKTLNEPSRAYLNQGNTAKDNQYGIVRDSKGNVIAEAGGKFRESIPLGVAGGKGMPAPAVLPVEQQLAGATFINKAGVRQTVDLPAERNVQPQPASTPQSARIQTDMDGVKHRETSPGEFEKIKTNYDNKLGGTDYLKVPGKEEPPQPPSLLKQPTAIDETKLAPLAAGGAINALEKELTIQAKVIPEVDETNIKPLDLKGEVTPDISSIDQNVLTPDQYTTNQFDSAAVYGAVPAYDAAAIGSDISQAIKPEINFDSAASQGIQQPQSLLQGINDTMQEPIRQLANNVSNVNNTVTSSGISQDANTQVTTVQERQTIPVQSDSGGVAMSSLSQAAQNSALEAFQNPLPRFVTNYLDQSINLVMP